LLAKLQQQFPEASQLTEVAEALVGTQWQEQIEKKDYDGARKHIADHSSLISAEKAMYYSGATFDCEARDLAERGAWDAASKIYRAGLEKYPENELLKNNAPLLFAQWAQQSMDQQDWKAAIKIYKLGLKSFPDYSLFHDNLKYCQQQLKGR